MRRKQLPAKPKGKPPEPTVATHKRQTVHIEDLRSPEGKITIAVWKCWECGVARPVGVKDPRSGIVIPLNQFPPQEREQIQKAVWEANKPKDKSGELLSSLGLQKEWNDFVFVVVSNRYCGC